MKVLLSLFVVAALSATALVGNAEELKSGLQPGKFIGAFDVTKCAGAAEDGVSVGDNLCYRCRYGGRPQVMVFTRSSDEKVAKLVSALDAEIKKHSDKELSVFVNFLGKDKETLTSDAEKFAKASKAKNVPLVVPNEFENGPENYGINPKAEITIILAGGGKVQANHAVGSAKELNVDAVLADIAKIVE